MPKILANFEMVSFDFVSDFYPIFYGTASNIQDKGNGSALLALCGNPLPNDEFPSQRTNLNFDLYLVLAWTICWTNSRLTDDLRRR